jgi:hypothetical protein
VIRSGRGRRDGNETTRDNARICQGEATTVHFPDIPHRGYEVVEKEPQCKLLPFLKTLWPRYPCAARRAKYPSTRVRSNLATSPISLLQNSQRLFGYLGRIGVGMAAGHVFDNVPCGGCGDMFQQYDCPDRAGPLLFGVVPA